MSRTVAGTLSLPDTGPLANAKIYFVAKRNEATSIVKGVTAFFTTDANGDYSQSVEPGYYGVSLSYTDAAGQPQHRVPLGNAWIETNAIAITLNALLAANESIADPTDAALQQLLADAQQARDDALSYRNAAEGYADDAAASAASADFKNYGLGSQNAISVADLNPINEIGFYRISSANSGTGNGPAPGSWEVLHWQFDSNSATQIAQNAGGSDTTPIRKFTRNKGSGVWTPWKEEYHQGTILGTVSQSGGVPTGAIIERGSNANGEYVKFADGTMICRYAKSGAIDSQTPTGNIFRSSAPYAWTFPSAFIEAPIVSGGVRTSSDVWVSGRPASATAGELKGYSSSNQSSLFTLDMLAVGRWY